MDISLRLLEIALILLLSNKSLSIIASSNPFDFAIFKSFLLAFSILVTSFFICFAAYFKILDLIFGDVVDKILEAFFDNSAIFCNLFNFSLKNNYIYFAFHLIFNPFFFFF